VGVAVGVVLCGLFLLQCSPWLFAEYGITYEAGSDWDWQFALYESCRQALVVHHELPTWDPFVQGGMPLLGHPEGLCFYPGFVLPLVFGTDLGLRLLVLTHLWLLVWGAWLAGREIGLGPVAAHGGGIVLALSSYLAGTIVKGHIVFLGLGWVFLAWVALRRGRWELSGLCLGMLCWAGGHNLVLFAGLLLFLDYLLRSLQPARLRWLVLALAVNGLSFGIPGARVPMFVLLGVALAVQRPRGAEQQGGPAGFTVLAKGLRHLLGTVGVAALVAAPKLVLFIEVAKVSARFNMGHLSHRLHDVYSLGAAWALLVDPDRVIVHLIPPPSFASPLPLVIGGIAVIALGWFRPGLAALGILFWSFSWSGSLATNLLDLFTWLPGYDKMHKAGRFSLIWLPFLGWAVADGVARLAALRRRAPAFLALGVGLLFVYGLLASVPLIARAQQDLRRDQPRPELAPRGEFFQIRSSSYTLFESARQNIGRLDMWNGIALPHPDIGLRARGDEDYRGEVFRLDDAELQAEIGMGRIRVETSVHGTVYFNRNYFPGWRLKGSSITAREGALSFEVPPGTHEFVYRPRGTYLSFLLAFLGCSLVAWRCTRWSASPGANSEGHSGSTMSSM
jgi:catechol 2,3-dioxygenase-like lactoylglutathione lyase family enzyme